MLYILRSYGENNQSILKIGFSDSLDDRMNHYFYMSPLSKQLGTREGDKMFEDLMHQYLYYKGYQFKLDNKLDEWFLDVPEVISIFSLPQETIEEELWKNREQAFNPSKITSDTCKENTIFKYLYEKNKDTFIGEEFIWDEDKNLVHASSPRVDVEFKRYLLRRGLLELPKPEQLSPGVEELVSDFLDNCFYTTGIFRERMKMYCEFMDKHGSKEVGDYLLCQIKDDRFQIYYKFYGTRGCSARTYREDQLAQGMRDATKKPELYDAIMKNFKVGSSYTLKEIKLTLKRIYEELGIVKNAKATDLRDYFTLVRIKLSDPATKKRIEGYKLETLICEL